MGGTWKAWTLRARAFVQHIGSKRLSQKIPTDIETLAFPLDDTFLSRDSCDQGMMYSASEIHNSMVMQEWTKLGFAESPLVKATNDVQTMNLRAASILEHHLSLV